MVLVGACEKVILYINAYQSYLYIITMIKQISNKQPIQTFKVQGNDEKLNVEFESIIKNEFKSYRVYAEVNEVISYHFQRMIYVSIIEFTLQQYRIHKNVDFLNRFVKLLKKATVNIEKVQVESASLRSVQQVNNQIAILQQYMFFESISREIEDFVSKDFDYSMVLVIRSIYQDSQGFFESLFSKLNSMKQTLVYKPEILEAIGEYFDYKFIVYKQKDNKYTVPKFEKDCIYVGNISNRLYSFYKTKKIQISIIQEKDIDLSRQTKSNIAPQLPQLKLNQKKSSKEKKNQVQNVKTEQKSVIKNQTQQAKSSLKLKQICSSCHQDIRKDLLMTYNYKFYCETCLLNPQVELQIPLHQIQKYFRSKNVSTTIQLPFECPTCRMSTVIKNYDPVSKKRIHRCNRCMQYICLKHNRDSTICYCYCIDCNLETYYDDRIKLKMCLGCKREVCGNCQGTCVCRCTNCKEFKGSEFCKCYSAEKDCHQCWNKYEFMIDCSCGGRMCRPCAFTKLESVNFKLRFKCPKVK